MKTLKEFVKHLDELLDGAKDKRDYHGEARKAFNDVVISGVKFKRALSKLSEVESKYKSERND